MEILVVVLIGAVIIAAVVCGYLLERRRRDALAALAARLGLRFSEEHDRATAERLGFLRKLDTGSNRYLYNRLSGDYQGHEVMASDYHYETYSHSKRGRRTQHHHLSVLDRKSVV